MENGFDLTPYRCWWTRRRRKEEAVAEREVETTTQNDDEEETGTLWSCPYSESGSDSMTKRRSSCRLSTLLRIADGDAIVHPGGCVAADSKEVEPSRLM